MGARTISEYEKAERAPYTDGPPGKMRRLASYYRWAPGSIDAVLAGGWPTLIPEVMALPVNSADLIQLAKGMSDEEKRELASVLFGNDENGRPNG